jgi:hypothetical protein
MVASGKFIHVSESTLHLLLYVPRTKLQPVRVSGKEICNFLVL